jgi:uncharacterized membrane protein YdjX (TVP38/TMEM64 family)
MTGVSMGSFDLTQTLVDFLRQWGELNASSAAVLAFTFIAIGLTPIPRTFFTLAAGVVFGMASVPIIIPATTIGCVIGFLLARYLLAGWLWRVIADKPKLTAIMNAVDAEGWHIVALCRLASPIPSTVQSAMFGLTHIGLWPYTWSTFVFTIPQLILYVYLGAIGKAALLGESEGISLGMMAAGGLTFLGVILLITRRVRANMREIDRSRTVATG